jgi:hypothetical protein
MDKGCGLWAEDYGLCAVDYGLWSVGCRMWDEDYGLWAVGSSYDPSKNNNLKLQFTCVNTVYTYKLHNETDALLYYISVRKEGVVKGTIERKSTVTCECAIINIH